MVCFLFDIERTLITLSMADQPQIRTQQDWKLWLERDAPSVRTQLLLWLTLAQSADTSQTTWRDCEMREKGIAVLVRDRTNDYSEQCLTIATVQLPENIQRKGWFKSFLTECCKANPWPLLVIEDVKNPHLRSFLEKMNCKALSDFYRTTYVVDQRAVLTLDAGPLKPYASYAQCLLRDV